MSDFKIKNGILTKYTGAGGDVVIPDSVTEIDERAFSGCASLTSITIPHGVTEIGKNAFSGCRSLKSITIPDSVTAIDWHAFSGCSSLTSITIPDNVTKIGAEAFSGCSSLQSITIPDSVTAIGDEVFYGCDSLVCITVGKGIGDFEKNKLKIGEHNALPEMIIAPHSSLENHTPGERRVMALGFAYAVEKGTEISDERKQEYLKYIKGQRKKLYPLAVKHLPLLRLILSQKMTDENDIEEVTALAEKENNTELTAMLLEYGNKNISKEKVEKNRQRIEESAFSGEYTVTDAKKRLEV